MRRHTKHSDTTKQVDKRGVHTSGTLGSAWKDTDCDDIAVRRCVGIADPAPTDTCREKVSTASAGSNAGATSFTDPSAVTLSNSGNSKDPPDETHGVAAPTPG